ncbi:MAG: hypothetical protein ABW110_01930 [Steroidobacteraceae bacterium]
MIATEELLHAANEAAAAESLHKARCTDGLPIIVPTPERVERMLLHSAGVPREASLGQLLPMGGDLTVEKAAINAVMAGCAPEVFPIVIAACEAVADPDFDAGPMQNTTHAVTPLIVVNGPARDLFGVSYGIGAMGPGWAANLTIGRAIRLVMINVGGGVPGIGDMATLGSPAKIALCLAEAEEASPFEPLHVSLGYAAGDSTVTLLQVEGPHSMMFSLTDVGDQAELFCRTLAAGFANPASNNIYTGVGAVAAALNPIHARLLHKHGWTRARVQQRLFELAQAPRTTLRAISGSNTDTIPHDREIARVVERPEDFLLFVAGEDGGAYSAYFPTWGGGKRGSVPVTKKIRIDEGCEIPASRRSLT